MELEKTFEELFDEQREKMMELIEGKNYKAARDMLLEIGNEADIAEAMEYIIDDFEIDKAVILFRMLPKDISVEVFAYLPTDDQVDIINKITDKEIQFILDEMYFDDMIDVLEELPANIVSRILEKTPREERKLINTFLNYPDDCAGSIMTPDYISLHESMTVAQALQKIKREGVDSETVYTCYVKDAGRRLIGIVSLRKLVVADEDAIIGDIMHDDYVYVNVTDDQEEVAEAFKKYDYLAMPVVDKEHRIVGIITVDDIIDVIEEETTEDFELMAGIMDSSDKEYLDMSVMHHVKSRLPWLILLSVSLMITGAIISRFEAMLSSVIALVSYLPLLMGTGGNTGSQAATLIIRGITVGDLEPRDALRVLWKEFRISLVIGLVISAINFVKILVLDRESVMIATVVCLSMMVVIAFAKIVGGMLPMLAKKIGIDPALMATPMISSITDMASVLTYFLLASILLGI
ncbi:MAG: magnesium transporter [Clostridiales bacterium]|nr:magnesium transporter [Clostridiales bacterium]